MEKMLCMDYLSFIRRPDGFEWNRLKDQGLLIEDGGLLSIQNGRNWDN